MYVTLPSPTVATHLYCCLLFFLFIFYNKFICGIPGVVSDKVTYAYLQMQIIFMKDIKGGQSQVNSC